MHQRKIALCVESWWSEENLFAWNFTRKRLFQDENSPDLADHIYIVHVNTKGKDEEPWDKGTAVLGDVRSELSSYEHSIIELDGDPVINIVQFLSEENIHICILTSKDHNRVKRRMVSDSVQQILSRACCACIVVSPRFSAGDHFRIQAKRQPDALVANSVTQYRRRVLVLLNTGSWDSALVEYTASNVILPGDLVTLVRCVNENIHRRNAEQFQTERDNMRELGWHKFKRNNITLAVEVIKNTNRNLCEFIESKGIDLLVMTKTDTSKLKISIKKENPLSQTFHERCPCPFMVVPTDVLKNFSILLPVATETRRSHKRSGSYPRSPLWMSFSRLKKRGNFSRFSAFSASALRPFGNRRRCKSMDSTDKDQELHSLDYLRSDSVDFSSADPPGMEMTTFCEPWRAEQGSPITSLSKEVSVEKISNSGGDCHVKDEEVRVLKQELSEKEKEITILKKCIDHLQKNDGC